MATTGWIITGDSQDVGGGGGLSWTSPSATTAEDGSTAIATTVLANEATTYLETVNFSGTSVIPTGSTINNISLRIKKMHTVASTGYVRDYSIRLYKNYVWTGTDLADTVTDWPLDTLANVDYDFDLGGTTWTVAELKAYGTGFRIAADIYTDEIDTVTAYIDAVWINVDYTAPAVITRPPMRYLQAINRASNY